jgi:hypothetical protein
MEKTAEDKTLKLQKIIFELSKDQKSLENPVQLEKYFEILEDIYFTENSRDGFRHYYSDIFGWITQIDKDPFGELGNLDVLSQNIDEIKNAYIKCAYNRKRNVCKSIEKLYDHINLDIARINYLKTIQSTSEDKMQMIDQQVFLLKQTMDQELSNAEDISKKVNNAYSEFVSILGIFSAIVLVFFGGTSIFANVIAAMYKTSIYKSVIICTITGEMLANVIFIFLCLLAKLLDRSIAAKVEEWEIYGNSIKRFRIRYPVVFYFNVLCLGILGITCCTWKINKSNIFEMFAALWRSILWGSTIVYDKRRLLIYMCVIWCIINIIFVLAYLFAKITDINIGWRINISHPRWISIQETSNNEFEIYKENWPETDILLKKYRNYRRAKRYMNLKIKVEKIKVAIKNLPKRIFLRYRVISTINIIFSILVIAIFSTK